MFLRLHLLVDTFRRLVDTLRGLKDLIKSRIFECLIILGLYSAFLGYFLKRFCVTCDDERFSVDCSIVMLRYFAIRIVVIV